jgi:exopolyphosphatase/guanosine-5'-triphosphate,3'-diphosphate pyrophosphatase
LSTGDDPQIADASAGDAGRATATGAAPGRPAAGPSAPHHGGKSGKGRRRRRRRRGPVYAQGSRPTSQPAPAISAEGRPPRTESPAPRARPLPSGGPLYAALDLGTNNCRLLIATPRDRGFRVVDAFSRIVRLGEGIGVTGRLGERAMARAIEALKVCAAKLADRDIAGARLIATEACRAAANGREFIERVEAETGLVLEIVTRETEARLAVAGCASLIDPQASGVILFDIGGGSSELVWIDLTTFADGGRRRLADHVRTWMSLPVGVVNISERHGGRRVTAEGFATMVAEVAEMLAGFPEGAALDQAVAAGRVHMLGTSGTVTTLAGVHLKLQRYDRRRVDGTWLTGAEVTGLVATLVAMDYAARVANPCIGRERADLVLAGCAILEAIRQRWPCDRLRVADRGLREGMLVELMAAGGAWRSASGRRSGETFNA